MISKPPESWQSGETAAVRSVRTAAGLGKGGALIARRGGHVARGLFCYFFAGLWGFAGLTGGLATGSLPTLVGVGAMAGFMFWAGRRAFAKARDITVR